MITVMDHQRTITKVPDLSHSLGDRLTQQEVLMAEETNERLTNERRGEVC